MSDITMCPGNGCPLKETCYRYKAKPSQYQSFFAELPPWDYDKDECTRYWEIEKEEQRG